MDRDNEHSVRFRNRSRQNSDLTIEEIRRDPESRRRQSFVEPIPRRVTRGILREPASRFEYDETEKPGIIRSDYGERSRDGPINRPGEFRVSFPEDTWTRIPSTFMSRAALAELNYPFEAEDDDLFVLKKYVASDNLDELCAQALENVKKNPSSNVYKNNRGRSRENSPQPSQFRRTARSASASSYGSGEYRYRESEPRSRTHTDIKYRTDFIPPESEWDYSDDYSEEPSFRLSRYNKRILNEDSAIILTEGISKNDLFNSPQPSTNFPQVGKVLRVLNSHYTGDGVIEGDHSTELKVVEETNVEGQSLFKWLQIEDISMNLDRFETAAKGLAGLTDLQISGIIKLFKRVRKDYDKPTHTSRFMTPATFSTTIGPEPRDQRETSLGQRSLIWMCLPYFLLQEYSANSSYLLPSSHPARTLLETQSSFTKKTRDMQQTVCKLPGTPKEHCFHIAQVWCLVVDESFLITCSRNPISSLMGQYISTSIDRSSLSAHNNPHHSRSPKFAPTHLLVSNASSLWSFPVEECQTWFSFLLHFWEFIPKRLQFSYRGGIITADSWPKIIAETSKASIKISMAEIKSETKDPAGVLIYSQPSALKDDTTQAPQSVLLQKSDTGITPQDGTDVNIDTQKMTSGTTGNEGTEVLPSPFAAENTMKAPQPDSQCDNMNHAFHVFAWLNEIPAKPGRTPNQLSHSANTSFNLDTVNLRYELQEIDRYLKSQQVYKDRTAYLTCNQRRRSDIYDVLARESEGLDREQSRRRKLHENKIAVVNKAETVFRFFLPSQFEGSTIAKFWGALERILSPISSRGLYDEIMSYNVLLRWLNQLNRNIRFVTEIFSQADITTRTNVELPEEFANAWIHFLMSLIRFDKNRRDSIGIGKHGSLCNRLLEDGMRKLFLDRQQKSLLKYSVLKPFDVASIANLALLGDITGGVPNILQSYSEYLNYLELAIEDSPLDRSHQENLRMFQQEISIILETLVQQRRNLDSSQEIPPDGLSRVVIPRVTNYPGRPPRRPDVTYRNLQSKVLRPYATEADQPVESYLNRRHRPPIIYPEYSRHGHNEIKPWSYEHDTPILASNQPINPTESNYIQNLLMQESYDIVDRKILEFEQMRELAREFELSIRGERTYHRERQEAAIFIFTIVTVIFLPLSTVAGILGMNTNDVRNMEIDQWVFWVTAIPLTIIVITICLIWTGELGNVASWFKNVGRGKNGQRPVEGRQIRRTDDYSRLDIRRRRSRSPSPPQSTELDYRVDDLLRRRRVRYPSPPPRYASYL